MPTPIIREALNAWRAAERTWETARIDDPDYQAASLDVIRAWLAYQEATGQPEPGAFLMVADDDLRYVAVSAGVKSSLGHRAEALIGATLADISPPDLIATGPAQWAEFLASGRQDGEYRLLAVDGREVLLGFQARAHHPIPGFHLSRLWPLPIRSESAPSEASRQHDQSGQVDQREP